MGKNKEFLEIGLLWMGVPFQTCDHEMGSVFYERKNCQQTQTACGAADK